MKRRTALLAGAGLVAAAAGAGLGWRRHGTPDRGDAADLAPTESAEEALAALWALRLERPEGGAELALAGLRGRPLIVNFWATWCVPCVEEMPLLDRFFRAAGGSGWQVAGLAVDNAPAVRRFLQQHPVAFPVGLLGADGVSLARSLGDSAGGLPFSVFVDAGGRIADRRLGKLDEARLADWKRRAAAS